MLEKLCVSISTSNFDQIRSLLSTYPFLEVRQDLCKIPPNEFSNLIEINPNLILTIKTNDSIKKDLSEALNSGIRYFDLDLIELDLDLINKALNQTNGKGIILSIHFFENDDLELVSSLIKKITIKPDFLKIASFSGDFLSTVKELLTNDHDLILVPMGEANTDIRYDLILDKQEFTYVFPDDHRSTAAGQLSFTDAAKRLKLHNKFAVFGSPISHSLSPKIFSTYNSVASHYTRIRSENIEQLERFNNAFDLSAFNITSPLKNEAFKKYKSKEESSQAISNINFVMRSENSLETFNTDILAFEEIIKNMDFETCLIVGAGATAETMLYVLNKLDKKVSITNRTLAKAKTLAKKYNSMILNYEDLDSNYAMYDLVISTIPFENFKKAHHYVRYNEGDEFANQWLYTQADKAYSGIMQLKKKKIYMKESSKINFVLIGFMGSGKSSLGKKISSELNIQHIDLDDEIEKRSGKTIEKIFQDEGERYFREKEKQVLNSVRTMKNQLISLGGGIVDDITNKILLSNSFVIYLHQDIDVIWDRIKHSNRPLVKRGKEYVEELYYRRLNNYFYFSDLVILNSDLEKTTGELIEEINNTRILER